LCCKSKPIKGINHKKGLKNQTRMKRDLKSRAFAFKLCLEIGGKVNKPGRGRKCNSGKRKTSHLQGEQGVKIGMKKLLHGKKGAKDKTARFGGGR